MSYQCLEADHDVQFYHTRFSSGQLAHWFHCKTCQAQSNWVPFDKIPYRFLETAAQWEWRPHFKGLPYIRLQ
jgi:hypothetical protein